MEGQHGADFLFPTAFSVIAWVMGRSVRTRSRLTEELHEAAVRAEEAHEEELARAAADERRRIAREMHDVVAHSVSVMVVQAGGARRILDRDPARAVEAAAHIEQTGRAALSEMRRLLGVLNAGEEAERAPAPGMRELERARRAHARRGPAGRADRRRRAAPAARRHRPRRLPRPAGGADQRDQVRAVRPDRRARALDAGRARARRSPTAGPAGRVATASAGTASSGCGSACACTVGSCGRDGATAAASRSGRGSRSWLTRRWSSYDPGAGADRGRPGAGARRLPHDPRRRGGPRRRRRGAGRR